jgi:hypothetical protein
MTDDTKNALLLLLGTAGLVLATLAGEGLI